MSMVSGCLTPRRSTLGWCLLVLALLGGCGTTASNKTEIVSQTEDSDAPVGSLTGESLDAFDSTFIDQSGTAVTLASYHGRPMVLAMLYTQCTSACPLLLNSLQKLERGLPSAQRGKTWFVLVTLDPAHDFPDTLRAFAASRGLPLERWRLLRGSRDATAELAAILGVKVREEGDGAIAHSSNIYLLSDDGVIRHTLVGLGADPAALVAARIAMK